jgi:LacI family transcriptional regulator
MSTIKDVAERAGVSITTVSHVINDTRFVSEDLQKRVYDAMRELDYHPNTLARSLRSGRTKTIGLIVPDISNLFFAEVARKIEDRGLEHGYSVILCNTDDEGSKESEYINVLIAKQVDGIIFISAGFRGENLQKPLSNKIPIVIADRDIVEVPADVVLVNNRQGGYLATSYLIGLGHKRIACISGPSRLTPSAQRIEGYRQALKEAGLEENGSLEIAGNFRYQGGESAMLKLLDGSDQPTAVFACNDMMALGAMRAINNHGLRVPKDFSLVGFDDIPISECVYPSITTIAQPIKQMADIVVDYLVERIDIKSNRKIKEMPEFRRTILETQLVVRDSCSNPVIYK